MLAMTAQFYCKIKIPTAVWLFSLLLFARWNLAIASPAPPGNTRFRPGRLLVQPKANVNLDRLSQTHRNFKTRLKHQFSRIHDLQVLEISEDADIDTVCSLYRRSGLVEFAEPDYWVYPALAPNDSKYLDGSLWHLNNDGQLGVAGADIRALKGWETLNSASDVIVAVVDTGVRTTHEDLAANLWINPGEIAGNGLDDDHNGYTDDVYGINAWATNASNGNPVDKHGHGTEVAGVLGAVGNNAKGVCGIAWGIKLMVCRFYDDAGNASISDLIESLDYARANGAQIVNASFITTDFSQSLSNALGSCRRAGMIIVAAAGNDTVNTDVTPYYPACFNLDNIVSVTATTPNNTLATFANYGAKSIDLGAPGDLIYTTSFAGDGAYARVSGTSFSTPMVTGALALMKARYPGDNYRQLIERLLVATDPLPALAGKCVSGGLLNLAKALGPMTADFVPSATNGMEPLTLSFTNTSFCSAANFLWDFGDGSTSSTISPTHIFATAGSYNVNLTAISSTGDTSNKSLIIGVLPRPMLQILARNPLTIQLTGQSNKSYILYESSDLQLWVPLATNTANADGLLTISISSSLSYPGQRFYRARAK